jgi:hypothetical protein
MMTEPSLRMARGGALLHLLGGVTGLVTLRAALHKGPGDGRTLTGAHIIAHSGANMLLGLAPVTARSRPALRGVIEYSALGAAYLNWLAIFCRGLWAFPPPGDLFAVDEQRAARPHREKIGRAIPTMLLYGVIPLTFICFGATLAALRHRR